MSKKLYWAIHLAALIAGMIVGYFIWRI